MANNKKLDDGLVGVWISCDPFETSVEHHISTADGAYEVEVRDSEDGELAEVSALNWDGDRLKYSSYWPSSGRLVKNSLLRIEDGRVALTFTYTSQDTLMRKNN